MGLIRLLQAIRNLTKSGAIKTIEDAYRLAKREVGERFNQVKKQVDDAYNQGKKEQTLDKRTKDIKKIDEEGIKSLDVKDAGTDKDFIDFVREQGDEAGANKIQKEVDRLNKIINEIHTEKVPHPKYLSILTLLSVSLVQNEVKKLRKPLFLSGFLSSTYLS